MNKPGKGGNQFAASYEDIGLIILIFELSFFQQAV